MTTTADRFIDALNAAEAPSIVRLEAELPVDVEPLTAYAALAADSSGDHAFLLESAAKADSSEPDGAYAAASPTDRRARYSFIGYDPVAVVRITGDDHRHQVLDADPLGSVYRPPPPDGDVLDQLHASMPPVEVANAPQSDRQHLGGGLVGFLAYEAVHDLWLDGEEHPRPDTEVPDAMFVVATKVVVLDHATDTATLVLTPYVTPEDDTTDIATQAAAEADEVRSLLAAATRPPRRPVRVERSTAGDRRDFEAAVETVGRHIDRGEVYQAVIARSRTLEGRVDPISLYEQLRRENPSPYMYLLEFDDLGVVGASPETLVTVAPEGPKRRITANPIAGTAPRGGDPTRGWPDPVEDRRLAGELLADPKERAEHTMLVDLARNDLRRVATSGSVGVTEFMAVRKYSHVQHIESEVEGYLDPSRRPVDAIRSGFPAGTLSGAPKHRAMTVIASIEAHSRGVYGGGVGYLAWDGGVDMAIAIRTATIHQGDPDRLVARAGAGVVAASDPSREFEETEAKLGGLLGAIDRLTAETEVASDA